MPLFDDLLSNFIVMWAVVDPIGTIPVFLAVTKEYSKSEQRRIAGYATLVALGILLFFLVVGEILLRSIGVPLSAFQVSGGLILLLFALDMIFGDSKPETELQLIRDAKETAIFPLAIPSIAGPGAILAVVLLTDNSRHAVLDQLMTALVLVTVLAFTYLFMLAAGQINKVVGRAGAIVISKVTGMVLASMAAANILVGVKAFFNL